MILLVTLGFPPLVGGIGTDSYLLAKYSSEKIVVLAPNCRGVENFDEAQRFKTIRMKFIDVQVFYRTGARSSLVDTLMLALVGVYVLLYTVKLKPWKLYFSHWTLSFLTVPFLRLLKIPYYFAAHGTEVKKPLESRFYRALLFFCAKYVRKIICLGYHQKVTLMKAGIPLSKLNAVNEGTDLELFKPDVDSSKVAQRYNLINKKVILTTGRLVKRKGHDMVIKSLPRVLEHVPNAVYLIVGNGMERENLEALVKELNLKEKVIFAGYVPKRDLPKFYNACDVFIMASREVDGDIEGFGIVYLEANACSKPVIAGKSGGTAAAVRHGVNGFLVNPVNVEEIADQIVLLLTNRKLAEEMGKKGRQLVKSKFNYALIAREIQDIMD